MSVDRRSHPRYPVNFRMSVRPFDSGEAFAAEAMTISRSSVQLLCEADLVTTLAKRSQPPYICELSFLADDATLLMIRAQVLTHRRISQQHYVLVLLFKGIDQQQEQTLDAMLHAAAPSMR